MNFNRKKSDKAVLAEIAGEDIHLDNKPEKQTKATKVKWARNTRRLRFGTASTVLTIIVIAAIVLLNVLVGTIADKFPVTWDLSGDKVFTLKQESVDLAKSMTHDVHIVVFSAESEFEKPTIGDYYGMQELNTNFKELYTALQQYASHSGGKLTYEFIDPDQEPTKFHKYAKYEVESGNILFLQGENRYKTCTIADLSNVEEASQEFTYYGSYTFESKVEKVLASNIYGLQGDNDRIVQVLTGHGEDSSVIAGLKSLYELNGFTFEELSIIGSAEFNPKAEVALIAAPSKDYSAAEIKRIQQWVYNNGNYGRHLMVYVNPTADCPNLYEFLKVEYEITVTDELIVESDPDRCLYGYENYLLSDVPAGKYTATSAGTALVCTPFARRLTTTMASAPAQEDAAIYTIGVPLTSYPSSAKLMKLESLLDQSTDKKVDPYKAADSAYPLTSMIVREINSYNNNTYESTFGTVTVSGCPSLAQSEIAQLGNFKNEDLLLDLVHAIFGNDTGITISNKVISTDMVTFSDAVQKVVGIGIFTVGLPVILLVICLVVFLRRKNL